MDNIRLNYYGPITTGVPREIGTVSRDEKSNANEQEANSFQDVLLETIQQNSQVNFSRHAVKRAVAHGIEITPENLARLNEGIRIASEKQLEDTLILVDQTAFVVNAKNNTVITAMSNGNAKGNIFTNIEGTVIA